MCVGGERLSVNLLIQLTLNFQTHVSVLREISFNFFIADFGDKSSDEDLSSACLCLLWIDLFVVNNVIAGGDDFINGIGRLVDDESKATGSSSCWIGLDIDALNFTILAEVIAELLC